MKSLSVGVSFGASLVNSRSKFDVSRPSDLKRREKRMLKLASKCERSRNTHNSGLIWWLDFARFDLVPVDSSEEYVVFYVLFARVRTTKSF